MELQYLGNVLILRAIQGAGKTTLWTERYVKSDCHSTDNFFVDEEGNYIFDHRRLPEAHDWNLRRFIYALISQRDLIMARSAEGATDEELAELARRHHAVVDNTNITVAEVAPYYQAAQALGFKVGILTLLCPWEVAAKRCVHDVPPMQIYKASLRLDEETLRFPPWWTHEVANSLA